jgi:hypothetical protein
LILFTDQIEAVFGPLGYTNPVFILAVYSPGLAGIGLMWRHYGIRGLGIYLRRLGLWRMPFAWWVFLLIGIPSGKYLSAAMQGTVNESLPFSPWYAVLPALAPRCSSGPSRSLAGVAWRYLFSSGGSRRSGRV